MNARNWVRIILCGWVTGVGWYVLSVVSLSVFNSNLLTTLQSSSAYPRWDGSVFFLIDLLMGIWAIWFYSLVRTSRSFTAAATVTGISWWAIKSLQSLKWFGQGFAPPVVAIVPLVTTFVAIILAVFVGAWLYDKVELRAKISAAAEST